MTFSDQHTETIPCPYCGEPNDIFVDQEEIGQTLCQDCWVCCRPIEVYTEWDDELEQIKIQGRTDNE
ncbi:CPXCG motif-containing cysteine-rich protein [Nitrosomonas sp.]|uniref:CPXCG motif-containing cysteine-rich protein n=1 Tax=Nitrosomonas sp. TaxID=42353 RepID=UPI001D99061C|nr:CPXCG motif-containing cysteine-rich protein [Nitrosomonas sp.]